MSIKKCLACACFLLTGITMSAQEETPQAKMQQFLKILQEQYVDSLDMEALVETMMEDALHVLDPFSTYDNRAKARKVEEYLGENNNRLEEDAAKRTSSDVINPNSLSITDVRIANGKIGYIHLLRFNEYTQEQLMDAFKRLKAKKISSLILDLSGNHGGYLDVGVGVANEFLDKGLTICSTLGQHSKRKEYIANGKGLMINIPLAVIVDSVSASAAEMLSSCMQDNDRAIIIGQRTFGKGLTQKLINLDDGTLLRLSYQRFYSPTGRCIQMPYDHKPQREGAYKSMFKHRPLYGGEGVVPDIITDNHEESVKSAIIYLSK